MPIHRVLSSAMRMRLGAPGAPSLMEMGVPAVLAFRSTMVRKPVNRPSGCNCCPTTYMVEPVRRALLAPPGMGRFGMCPVVGSLPDPWLTWKIMGEVGSWEMEAAEPPHSGPQLRMYAVPPSGEKMALMGRSKASGAP